MNNVISHWHSCSITLLTFSYKIKHCIHGESSSRFHYTKWTKRLLHNLFLDQSLSVYSSNRSWFNNFAIVTDVTNSISWDDCIWNACIFNCHIVISFQLLRNINKIDYYDTDIWYSSSEGMNATRLQNRQCVQQYQVGLCFQLINATLQYSCVKRPHP